MKDGLSLRQHLSYTLSTFVKRRFLSFFHILTKIHSEDRNFIAFCLFFFFILVK